MEMLSGRGRLDLYQSTVYSRPALSPADATDLAWRAWFGDQEAALELIERHLWLVLELAQRLRPFERQAPARLVAVGNRALVDAAESYRPWGVDGGFADFASDRLMESMTREALPTA